MAESLMQRFEKIKRRETTDRVKREVASGVRRPLPPKEKTNASENRSRS
ncbi:hypothetical protein [Enterovirga sp. CN4-39]